MFWEFLLFEIRYQLRQPVFYIGTALFFLLTFGAVTTDAISIGGGIGSLNRNAPYVIMQILAVMSILGVFTSTAIVANSTYRDIEHNTQSVFFCFCPLCFRHRITLPVVMKWGFLGQFLLEPATLGLPPELPHRVITLGQLLVEIILEPMIIITWTVMSKNTVRKPSCFR